jgi:hypothetical protein
MPSKSFTSCLPSGLTRTRRVARLALKTLHLGETHRADSTGRSARGGGEIIPLGTEQSSRIFPR